MPDIVTMDELKKIDSGYITLRVDTDSDSFYIYLSRCIDGLCAMTEYQVYRQVDATRVEFCSDNLWQFLTFHPASVNLFILDDFDGFQPFKEKVIQMRKNLDLFINDRLIG